MVLLTIGSLLSSRTEIIVECHLNNPLVTDVKTSNPGALTDSWINCSLSSKGGRIIRQPIRYRREAQDLHRGRCFLEITWGIAIFVGPSDCPSDHILHRAFRPLPRVQEILAGVPSYKFRTHHAQQSSPNRIGKSLSLCYWIATLGLLEWQTARRVSISYSVCISQFLPLSNT